MRRLVLLLAAMFAVAYAVPAAADEGHPPKDCEHAEQKSEECETPPETTPETPPETTPETPPPTTTPETPPVETTPVTPPPTTPDTPEYTVPDTTTPDTPETPDTEQGETQGEEENTTPDDTPTSQPQSPTSDTTEANALPRTGTDGQVYSIVFLGIVGAVALLGGTALRRVLSL
jgi:outer membrane biosynthesis protein TonB